MRTEFINPYGMWLSFEVRDIITSEEVAVLKSLRTDDEREEFIQQFWERRNPEPGSLENKFKQDFYRRHVCANELFSRTAPGWKTDRGRIYVAYGPPDEIVSHPQGGIMPWSSQRVGADPVPYPFERWTYRVMDRVGPNQVLIFADPTRTGDFRLVANPEGKVVLMPDRRRDPMKGTDRGVSAEPFLKPSHPPAPVKFPDLRAVMTSGQLSANPIPILVRTYTFPATEAVELAVVAVQMPGRDLQFQNKNGMMQSRVETYGRIEALSGRIVAAFEKTRVVDLPIGENDKGCKDKFVFEESIPLGPGRYRFSLALKDEASGRTGMLIAPLTVPLFDSGLLSTTPLILADSIEPLESSPPELEQFAIGRNTVHTNPGQAFSRDGAMGVYLQIHNLRIDPETNKANFTVEYEILNRVDKPGPDMGEPARLLSDSTEFTLAKNILLKGFKPGTYSFRIKITDIVAKQTIAPSTMFSVR
ncbi:MAG: GWxTD domain-containing protein [Acidobacteriota bacterium]|nr:GWxTD domain-containing protein [Acidobacteriota bacterium]